MRHFFSDDQARSTHHLHGGERWWFQGNLGRSRWRRWFRVAGTGKDSDLEVEPAPENLASVLAIIRERQYGKQVRQFTVAQDQSAFMPLSSLEVGTERSRAICRIARYFSIDTLGELVDSIKASPNAADYQDANLLKEIFTIPEQVAIEVFRGGSDPLDALKTLDESQLSKLNPIAIGTGFLVGGTHLMTNNHVISDTIEATECVAQFNYVKDALGNAQQTVDYELDPSFLFVTNPDLDYTLVQLKSGMFTRQAGYIFGWLQLLGDDTLIMPGLSSEQAQQVNGQANHEPVSYVTQVAKFKPIPGDRVFLVQHPKGQQKQIVQNDNRVLDYDQQGLLKNFLRYTAASDYGSSGSPVFNTNWDLVALHHAVLAPAPESDLAPVSESDHQSLSNSDKPTTSQDNQCQGQGVRICRIVEDLQTKSLNLPKLKNFIEDFVITKEQLTYPPFPGALSFAGTNQYIYFDFSILVMSASRDGTIKLWSRAGEELKTLHLDVAESGTIEQICFSPDGAIAIVARQSTQPDQRSRIEVWDIKGNNLQDVAATLRTTFAHSTNRQPIRNEQPQIGDLIFCENFSWGDYEGIAIAALTTDGYLDLLQLDNTLIDLIETVDIYQQDLDNLVSIPEIEQQIDELERNKTGIWFIHSEEYKQISKEISLHQQNLEFLKSLSEGTHHYTISTPVLRYSSRDSTLIYSGRNSVFVWRKNKANSDEIQDHIIQIKIYTLLRNICLNPTSPEIAIVETSTINFWQLDGTPLIREDGRVVSLSNNVGSIASYTNDGNNFLYFANDYHGDKSLYSYDLEKPNNLYSVAKLDRIEELQAIELNFSADNTLLIRLLANGEISLRRYYHSSGLGDFSLLSTFFHEEAISILSEPTGILSAYSNPFSFMENRAYTLEMWVKPHHGSQGIILEKGSRIGIEYMAEISNGNIWFHSEDRAFDSGKFEPGKFFHLAVVAYPQTDPKIKEVVLENFYYTDPKTPVIFFYVNGVEVYKNPSYRVERSNANPTAIAQGPLLIGGGLSKHYFPVNNSSDNWTSDQGILPNLPGFFGLISEVRIWNTTRTPEQIKADQNRRLSIDEANANGLVGYWRFEETQDNRIINLAGDGDYGMIVGAEVVPQTEAPQRFVSALMLHSPSSQVDCGHDVSLATPAAITLEAWVKRSFGDGWIVNRLEANKPGYALAWQDNKIRVILQSAKAITIVDTQQPTPSDRAFHHIAFTWAQAFEEIQIYIDGRRQDTVSIKGDYEAILIDGQYRSTALFKDALANVEMPLVIGKAFSPQTHRSWVMAEVRLWNVARTQNQIQFMMAKHIPQATPGLVGYWRLDDGGAIAHNRVADWQGRSNPEHHGRVQEAQWFPDTALSSGDEGDRADGVSDNSPVDGLIVDPPVDGLIVDPPVDEPILDPPVDEPILDPPVDEPILDPPVDEPILDPPVDEPILDPPVDEPILDPPVDEPADIQNHWAQPFIESLLAQPIFAITPSGDFRPDEGVTVEEYGTAIAAAFNLPLRQEAAAFSNLSATNPHYANVQKAYRMGFLLPKDNAIDLQRQITRLEAMVYFVRGLNLKGGTLNLISGYPDSNIIPEALRSLVATALRHGLVVAPHQTQQLAPQRPLTRGELAALVYQGWVHQGQAEMLPSPHIVQLEEPLALFVDVLNPSKPHHWAEDFIRGLVDLGIINGFVDGTFHPEATVARIHYAGMLVSAFDPPSRSDREQVDISQLFRDVPSTSRQFKVVERIYRSGAMSGFNDGTFGVTTAIPREQAIAALVNILNLRADTLTSLNRYPDRATISPWAEGAIAAATEAGLIVSSSSSSPAPIRAKQPTTRAEVATLVYQGLVVKGMVPPIQSAP